MSFQKEYVRSMKLAGILMQKGFRILSIEKDKHNPEFDVYVFRSTEELTKTIFEFINSQNGGKNDYNTKSRSYYNNKKC